MEEHGYLFGKLLHCLLYFLLRTITIHSNINCFCYGLCAVFHGRKVHGKQLQKDVALVITIRVFSLLWKLSAYTLLQPTILTVFRMTLPPYSCQIIIKSFVSRSNLFTMNVLKTDRDQMVRVFSCPNCCFMMRIYMHHETTFLALSSHRTCPDQLCQVLQRK